MRRRPRPERGPARRGEDLARGKATPRRNEPETRSLPLPGTALDQPAKRPGLRTGLPRVMHRLPCGRWNARPLASPARLRHRCPAEPAKHPSLQPRSSCSIPPSTRHRNTGPLTSLGTTTASAFCRPNEASRPPGQVAPRNAPLSTRRRNVEPLTFLGKTTASLFRPPYKAPKPPGGVAPLDAPPSTRHDHDIGVLPGATSFARRMELQEWFPLPFGLPFTSRLNEPPPSAQPRSRVCQTP